MDRAAQVENLRFIAGMLPEIRRKAEAAGEDLLTYLLDMAVIEAEERAKTIARSLQTP